MNGLFQTICRIGIFMICAQAVIHFRPEESYEKYLRLLVSAMVLIQLFLPVGRFLFHGDGRELTLKSEAFLRDLEAEISAAESRAYESEALLEQMSLEEIRRRVEEQASMEGTGAAGQTSGERTSVENPMGISDTDDTDGIYGTGRIEVEEIRVRIPSDSPE